MSRLTADALALFLSISAASVPAAASAIYFSPGNPDGKIAALSHTASRGQTETETAEDSPQRSDGHPAGYVYRIAAKPRATEP